MEKTYAAQLQVQLIVEGEDGMVTQLTTDEVALRGEWMEVHQLVLKGMEVAFAKFCEALRRR